MRFINLCKTPKVKLTFSLIELLLIVAIMGALGSLLSPSLKKIISASRDLQCQNNLKRVMTATFSYSDDFNHYFPHYHRSPVPVWDVWFRSPMRPYYINSTEQYQAQSCPTSIEKWSAFGLSPKPKFTYSINRRVSCDVNIKPVYDFKAMVETKYPSKTITFLDGQEYRVRKGLTKAGIAHYAIGGGLKYTNEDMIHDFGINTSFIDGHVENVDVEIFFSYSQTYSSFWNPLFSD